MSFFDLGDVATGGLLSAGGSILGGLIGAGGASSAAGTQAQSAKNALDFEKEQFNTLQEQGAPYRAAGVTALNDIAGMKPYLTHQFDANDLKAGLAPNYDFMLEQGQQANQRAANVGGGLIGGNALQGLNRYTQDYAGTGYQNAFTNYQNERNNIYNTLAGIAGIGQNAYNTSANTGTQMAGQIGNTMQNIGTAQAGGTVGAANALSGGLQNAGNAYMLSQLLASKNPAVVPA